MTLMTQLLEGDDRIVTLTERAIIAVKEVMLDESTTGDGLRVAVVGGGCAGYQHTLDFSDAKENDFVAVQDGLTIYVDPMSAMHLEGTIIDYVTGISGNGFKFNNPSVTNMCGCGSSFST